MSMRTDRVHRLLLAFIAGALIAAPFAGCNDAPTDPPVQSSDDVAQAVHRKINDYRATKGLPAFTFNEVVAAQARQHSSGMAAGSVPFGHDGFEGRVTTIAQSVALSNAAENVAFNSGFSDPASEAVRGWLNSTGHRENIEGDFDITGIGVVKGPTGTYYFTQIFVKR
jgi:uncharacterized protein YkwD